MSSGSTPVDARHFAYIAERTRGDDAFLLDLKAAALAADIPPIWIAPEQASFLRILLAAAGARRVVEVGTLAGYAAIAMARGLPAASAGGWLGTIELEPRHADFAADWIARSDVADRVEVLRGDGAAILPTLETGSLDAIFLDADKSGYPRYLEEGLRLVRGGGLVLVDNAFAFGQLLDEHPTDREVPAVRAFNDLVAATDELDAVIVPLGDGMWVGRRT